MSEVFSKVHSHTFPAISYIFCTEKLLSAPVVNNISELDSFLNGFGHGTNFPFDKYCAFSFVIVHELLL